MFDLFGQWTVPQNRQSPLPYPGGKWYARRQIIYHFPKVGKMVSPFCGGCHIELDCAYNGMVVYASDIYKDLINFWQHLQDHPQAMYDKGSSYLAHSTAEYNALKDKYKHAADPLDKAALFYAVHKSSYSGTGFAGGWHGKQKHFTMHSKSVKAMQTFSCQNMVFECLDFEHALAKHKDLFAYLDPPYMIEYSSNLYGNKGELHAAFDHDRLCKVLRSRQTPWALSYNDSKEIMQMYKGYRYKYPVWHWGMSNRSSNEVLIMNY